MPPERRGIQKVVNVEVNQRHLLKAIAGEREQLKSNPGEPQYKFKAATIRSRNNLLWKILCF